MKSRLRKNPFIRTAEEYASQSSIHGIGYVFDQKLGLVDRLIWMVVVLAFLSLASYLTQNMWTQYCILGSVATLSTSMTSIPITTAYNISMSINNRQSLISKVFSRYLHISQVGSTVSVSE